MKSRTRVKFCRRRRGVCAEGQPSRRHCRARGMAPHDAVRPWVRRYRVHARATRFPADAREADPRPVPVARVAPDTHRRMRVPFHLPTTRAPVRRRVARDQSPARAPCSRLPSASCSPPPRTTARTAPRTPRDPNEACVAVRRRRASPISTSPPRTTTTLAPQTTPRPPISARSPPSIPP